MSLNEPVFELEEDTALHGRALHRIVRPLRAAALAVFAGVAAKQPASDREGFIVWVPIIVPLFAVLLLALVFLIDVF